jgi:hypothetical protein
MGTDLREGGHDGERNVADLIVVNLDKEEKSFSLQISCAQCFLLTSPGNE